MSNLYVVAVGRVSPGPMEWAESTASEWFPFPVRRLPDLPIPLEAHDSERKQLRSVEIMKALARAAPKDTVRLLGLTEADLAIPMLSFLFGQAQFDGPVAVVSLCRLRQEFYGLQGEDALLRERLAKEMLHELGHTFGLTHCADSQCAMSLSTHISLVDSKRALFCKRCAGRLARRFGPRIGGPV